MIKNMKIHSGGLAMGLNKAKLGNFIEQRDERNFDNRYTLDDIKGISTGKQFIDTKANMDGVSLTSYKVVNDGEFAYVADTSRRGDKIALAFNDSKKPVLISSIYTVFRVKKKDLLLSDYLFIYFNRPEFDRYARFNSWGSARETFSWEDMCDIDIDLPPLEIQQKYVDIYNAMVANQKAYETGLEDLKLVCDGYLDSIKKTATKVSIGNIFETVDVRNTDMAITSVSGINITKSFMPSVANVDDGSLKNYKIVKTNQFAFSGMQTGRDKCIRVALNQQKDDVIISPAYTVFQINSSDVLEEYIMLWFSRSESDRLGWFVSDSSIRSNLDLDRLFEIKIPVPSMEEQKSIANIYTAYKERQAINEHLKAQIKDICPILIKGSLEEAR